MLSPKHLGGHDGTHFSTSKPNGTLCEDYFYHKTIRYSGVFQAIVDDQKQFTNIFMGLPGSVNEFRVVRRSTIYYFVQFQGLFNANKSQEGFFPLMLGDKGYPLLFWLMTLPKEGNHNLLKMLYNRKHKQVRSFVENVFGILKKIFHEL
jgi:hypothetical protein